MSLLDPSKREWRHILLMLGTRQLADMWAFGPTAHELKWLRGQWAVCIGGSIIHLGDGCEFAPGADSDTLVVSINEEAL